MGPPRQCSPLQTGGGLCLSNASQGWLLQEGFREQNYSLRVFRWSEKVRPLRGLLERNAKGGRPPKMSLLFFIYF